MKRIAKALAFTASLALLPTVVVQAQAPAAPPAAAQAAEARAPVKPASKRRGLAQADARACLDLATNFEIIACAEKYR